LLNPSAIVNRSFCSISKLVTPTLHLPLFTHSKQRSALKKHLTN
jgi:hypothetical protein